MSVRYSQTVTRSESLPYTRTLPRERYGVNPDLWSLLFYRAADWDVSNGRELEEISSLGQIGKSFRGRNLAVIARTETAFRGCDRVPNALGANVYWCPYLRDAIFDASASPDKWAAVIIKLEDYGSVSSLFNFLRSMRMHFPTLAIVLASGDFRADDLSTERLVLCDASLKLPSSAASVVDAINAAIENNQIWVKRIQELHGDAFPS